MGYIATENKGKPKNPLIFDSWLFGSIQIDRR
jgi:hypothetical protein